MLIRFVTINYITIYIVLAYLAALADLFSAKVLICPPTSILERELCHGAHGNVLGDDCKPTILQFDQSCQLESSAFVDRSQAEGIKISRQGIKYCHDNIMAERVWQTDKD